jgi:hypothetical protein
MTEAQLCKVEGANEALDRSDRIVRPHIVLDPGWKQTGLLTAVAGFECAIRHKPNRISTPKKVEFLPSLDQRFRCPALQRKIFRLTRRANHPYKAAPSRPLERGVSRSSRTLGAGCGGRGDVKRRMTLICGRRSRVVLAPQRWRQVFAELSVRATVAKEPGHGGAPRKPLKPSRRECRLMAAYLR